MPERQFTQEITIACDPETVFDYITNPNKWHEWYPSSLPTDKEYQAQVVGQEFEVLTVQKPIKILPFEITKSLQYTVTKSDRAKVWEINARSSLVDSTTTYTLTKFEGGTVFKREFRYQTKSWLRYVEPLLLRKRIFSQAREGLDKLKLRVELGSK